MLQTKIRKSTWWPKLCYVFKKPFFNSPLGLDATTAVAVIELLRKQAERHRTVIFSIHQPRYSIFKLFDNVTLMSRGSILYAGPPGEHMLKYFEDLGQKCETYNNPADHVLDVIIAMERAKPIDAGRVKFHCYH